MSAYSGYLASAEWRSVSAERRYIDGYKCVCCGATEGLNVHHLYYPKDVYDTTSEMLVTLCHACHRLVHRIQELYDEAKRRDALKGTKNGFVDYSSAMYEWLTRQAQRWVAVEVWSRNLLSTKEVSEYVRAVEGVYNQSGRLRFYLDVGKIMEMLALVKDCWIANKSPVFNESRRKNKRGKKTRFQ